MHIRNPNASVCESAFKIKLTGLACILMGVFSTSAQASDLYGCQNTSLVKAENSNGCSVSVGLNQKNDGYVFGGLADNGTANNNRVNIAHGANITSTVNGGFTTKKEANHNEVVIGNNVQIGTGRDGGYVKGGTSIESTSDFNAVRIGTNVTVAGSVIGGDGGSYNKSVANNVSASSNSVHIGDLSYITSSVSGGSGGKTSSFNEVVIGNGVRVGSEVSITSSGGIVEGGSASVKSDFMSQEANSNVVHIGDDAQIGMISGGVANAVFSKNNVANDNRVTIGNRSHTLLVSGAEGWESSTVTNNSVTIGTDAVAGEIYGARSSSGNVSKNTVQVGKNLVANFVTGGDAYSAVAGEGNAHNNTVVLGENAKVAGNIIGGSALTKANNNTVVLHKGFHIGGVGGGSAQNESSNNTVTLFAGTVDNNIAGGTSFHSKGNVLNLGTAKEGIEMNKLKAEEVLNFDTINFYLPDNVRHNDTVLNLSTSYLELGNTTMNAYVPGNANLHSGDVVHLIKANDGLFWSGKGNVYQGITLAHDLASIALTADNKNLDLTFKRSNQQKITPVTDSKTKPVVNTSTTATKPVVNTNTTATKPAVNTNTTATKPVVNTNTTANKPVVNTNTTETTTKPVVNADATPVTAVNPKTKSLVQGRLVAPALVNNGASYLAGGLNSLYQDANLSQVGANESGFVQAGTADRDITTGSYVNLKGLTLDAGYAWNKPSVSGNWLYGVAAEYGYSHYTAHLDDGTKGKGKAWNLGADVFSNYLWNNGLYAQVSLRAGRVWNDYRSDDFIHANGTGVRYKSNANYLASHVGFGKVWQLGENNSLDTYVKYFYSHTSGDEAHLSSGETYHFSSVRSKRGRVGVQYNHNLSNLGMHFGVAYEREWNGDVRAQYQGYALPTPTMKGGTTIAEAGVDYKLAGKQFNTTLQGYAGRQKGLGIRFGMTF
ncbi:autotransporter domain-containing protein [uncultured Haemophilus sp.]|uniref:autotransporter domain-containing protein n=1 Tax=uncultured Haemophilus sp. TaxID=237779 RepID=UPI00258A2AE8|nr:autotransporter domain-containing protein [uncultured Haemophilus sp.]